MDSKVAAYLPTVDGDRVAGALLEADLRTEGEGEDA